MLVTEDKDFGKLVFLRRLLHPCIVRLVELSVAETADAIRDLIERHGDAMRDERSSSSPLIACGYGQRQVSNATTAREQMVAARREASETLRSIELFVGAGGLGMGVDHAGFQHELVVDVDRHACETIRENQAARHPVVAGWPLCQCDVRDLDFRSFGPGVDLVSGGPPCQPFSLGGKHHGPLDQRDMFPEAIRAVRELSPMAFIFENVRGLWRPAFSRYLQHIRDHLTFPQLTTRADESWLDHASRLRHHCDTARANQYEGLAYRTSLCILNAANFGVPQKRERMIMVGFRADLNIDWSFPKPTHSPDALLWDKWISGAYWDRHRIAKRDRPPMPDKVRRRVERLCGIDIPPPLKPWRTVRDAIAELPDPERLTQ